MVRATAEDLEIVQAAIETLGGRALKAQAVKEELDSKTASAVGKADRQSF
jgi:hypothetical protein